MIAPLLAFSARSLKGLAKAAKKTAILHPGQEKGRFPRGLAHDEESKFYFKAIHHAAAAPASTVYILRYILLSMCCFHAEPLLRFLYFAQLSLSFLLFSYIRGRTLCCVCVWGESSPPTALMKAKEKGLSYCYCLFVILRTGWFSTLYSIVVHQIYTIFEFRQICFKQRIWTFHFGKNKGSC